MSELNDHSVRAHALFSASGSERWLACPASAKLAEKYPKQDTAFTREGTLAHEVAEAIASGAVLETIGFMTSENVDPDMVRHATDYRDYIDGLCRPGTTKMLEVRVDFSPWVPEGFGTADCILLHDDRSMDVIDYKYGQGVEVSAENNPQMQLYGLGAYNDYGFVYDIHTIRMHIFQPRKDNISVWETDLDSLLKFGEHARERASDALGENPDFGVGSHCRFCPHAPKCFRLAWECLRAVSPEDEVMPDLVTLTPQGVAYIVSKAPMIEKWLDAVKSQALADVLAGKEVPGFKAVEGKLGIRKWTNEFEALKVLDEYGIEREVSTEVKLLSPTKLEGVLKKQLGKDKAADIMRSFVQRSPGSPTLVPASDKRPSINIENDFENLEEK